MNSGMQPPVQPGVPTQQVGPPLEIGRQHWEPTQPLGNGMSPQQASAPFKKQKGKKTQIGADMSSGAPDIQTAERPKRRRGVGLGCGIGCLTLLVVAAIIVLGGWIFLVRPFAQGQIDDAMTRSVRQIGPEVALIPPGPFAVSENTFNNMIVLNLSPNSPIQNPQTSITPQAMRIQFQVYGNTNTVSGVPKMDQGKITVTDVKIDGLASLLISPDELTKMLNKHLADAQVRLKHDIQGIQLKNHEMVIQFGAPTGVPLP